MGRNLTKSETAGRLGRCENQVDRYRRAGRLRFKTVAGRIMFDEADVEALKKELKGTTRPVPARGTAS
jgi:hypothetical protein